MLLLASLAAASDMNQPLSVVPDREVMQQDTQLPGWKNMWDEARVLVRQGNYEAAVEKYEALLAEKESLTEARWEFARLLRQMKENDKAVRVLELLLEANPEQGEYLKELAGVLQEQGLYRRSVDLLLRVHKQDSNDAAVLEGITTGMTALGKKKEMLPFLEALYWQQPKNGVLRRQLATLAYDLGDYNKAREHLVPLAEAPGASVDILRMTARSLDTLALDNLAGDYWQRLVKIEPDNIEGHERLAAYYEKKGRLNDVLRHLLALQPARVYDTALMLRIGKLYFAMEQYAEALPYIENYIRQNSGDRQAIQSLIEIYARLGEKAKTLVWLERLFSLESIPDAATLKQAARLYDEVGRYRDAILLYRRLLEITPDDQEIIKLLANDLLAIGENEGALFLLQQLIRNKPEDSEIYGGIAELLEKLGRYQELVSVLEAAVKVAPGDIKAKIKLAQVYWQAGRHRDGRLIVTELMGSALPDPVLYSLRGVLFESYGYDQRALLDYERYIDLLAEDRTAGVDARDIRLRCLRLAGRLGRAEDIYRHITALQGAGDTVQDKNVLLIIADAFRESGIFETAMKYYQDAYRYDPLTSGSLSESERQIAHETLLSLAKLYKTAGMPYETEESLRQAYQVGYDPLNVLKLLAELALANGMPEDAEVWIQRLSVLIYSGKGGPGGIFSGPEWEENLLQARLKLAQGSRFFALRLARDLRVILFDQLLSDPTDANQRTETIQEGIKLGIFFVEASRYAEAEEVCARLLQYAENDLESLALLYVTQMKNGKTQKAEEILVRTLSVVQVDFGKQFLLAAILQKYDLWDAMVPLAEDLVKMRPDSINAGLLLAEAYERTGRREEAVRQLEEVTVKYPENSRILSLQAVMAFRMGRYEEALTHSEFILAREPNRLDIRLLKARALWAVHKWGQSIAEYEDILQPAIEKRLQQMADSLGLVAVSPKQPGILGVAALFETEAGGVETIMNASHAVDNEELPARQFNDMAAVVFSEYCWQKSVARELGARKAVQRQEYYQAVKLYKTLIRDFPEEDTLLFDLAGIYSKMDRISDEAVIYEELSARAARVPGLSEAITRNSLKRKPWMSVQYGKRHDEGWDGTKAIKKEWQAVSFWMSPFSQHEVDFSAFRNNYQSTENNEEELSSQRAYVTFRSNFFQGVSFDIGGGVERLKDGFANMNLIDCSLSGDLGDRLESHVTFKRDVTADTIESLQRNIMHEDVEVGVAVDLMPRLQAGSDYGYTSYSDGNLTEGYTLWASYVMFSEPTKLSFGYAYEFMDSRESSSPGLLLGAGTESKDHPYWVPRNYWLNNFSVSFKHQLSEEKFGRGVPRYYVIEYALGHNSQGYLVQNVKNKFFLELTSHIILEASGEITSSQPYLNREGAVSLRYRW